VSYRVQSVERGIDILTALKDGPQTVTEIAAATGLAKGTAFRLLASLGYQQFVVREPRGSRYMLGPGLLPLMYEIKASFGWIGALAGAPLRSLWKRTGETVTVNVRIGTERICVEELPSAQPIRYTADIGAAAPLHIGSAGKVLLAFMDEAELEELLPQLTMAGGTDRAIKQRTQLLEEVELTRERKWATSAGERVLGSGALSVPVRVPGMVLAALSVLGPLDRLTEEKQQEYLPLVQRTARAIERSIASSNGKTGDS